MRTLQFISLSCRAPAQASPFASEEILDYHSDIRVQQDASLLVTETIRVRSAAVDIRHGIYRDFPTRYKDWLGNRYVIHFAVMEVIRDGQPEKFHMQEQTNGERIYIGDENVMLTPGEYTYALTYTANREIGFFADHDELYWNVTGSGWAFPIAHATATVTLPENIPASSIRMDGYTGPQGARGKAFTSSIETGSAVSFVCTQPLSRRRRIHPGRLLAQGLYPGTKRLKLVSAILLKTTGRPWPVLPACYWCCSTTASCGCWCAEVPPNRRSSRLMNHPPDYLLRLCATWCAWVLMTRPSLQRFLIWRSKTISP